MNRIEELRTQISEATEATAPQREELAQLEAEQAREHAAEQQRQQERRIEWANDYIRKGNKTDRTELDNELREAQTELTKALAKSPIVKALAKLSALEQRKQLITDDLVRARNILGQQPNPVEHTMRFNPITTITEAIGQAADELVSEERDTREQNHHTLITATTPIGDDQPAIDPTTLPIHERAAHGHDVEQYTQSVEGYGLVSVTRDNTTGETIIDDPAYHEWVTQAEQEAE